MNDTLSGVPHWRDPTEDEHRVFIAVEEIDAIRKKQLDVIRTAVIPLAFVAFMALTVRPIGN